MTGVPPGRHPNWCKCHWCRADIAEFESRQFKGSVAVFAAVLAITGIIAGIIWMAVAPLRIWHVTGADGQQHPDAATWIAYGVSGGVILAVMIWVIVRATREPGREAEASRIAEALDIADREGRA